MSYIKFAMVKVSLLLTNQIALCSIEEPTIAMEEGYSAIDDAALTVRSDQKVFLFRFPKDVSIEKYHHYGEI